MNLRLACTVAVGVSGIVFACGGSASNGGAGTTATDSQAFISEFCGLFAPCCGKVNKPTDGAACRALYAGLLGSSQYDASKGNLCLNELRARSSAPDFCDNPTAQTPSCDGAFREGSGSAQPGDDCSEDGDCASSAEGTVDCASSYSGSATTRSCQIKIEGKAGDTPCVGTRDGNTLVTSSTFTSGSDAGPPRPPARGYVCDSAKGIFCNSKSTACEAIHDVGGGCTISDRYSCVQTAVCDPATQKCVARIEVGGDCSKRPDGCVAQANCDRQTRKCIAGLPDGTSCTTSDACASNACVNGKCDRSGSSALTTQLLCGGG